MGNKFGEGRVFVAGGKSFEFTHRPFSNFFFSDAAHVHSLVGAQGLNSSIQDSVDHHILILLIIDTHCLYLVQSCMEDFFSVQGPSISVAS